MTGNTPAHTFKHTIPAELHKPAVHLPPVEQTTCDGSRGRNRKERWNDERRRSNRELVMISGRTAEIYKIIT